MHMHTHLRSCMLDYGPLHGFWLYTFERYNGVLGSIPHNNHSIEVQIMRRFLQDNETFNAVLPTNEFACDFKDIFPDNKTGIPGSLGDTVGFFYSSTPSQAKGWAINSPGLLIDLPSHYIRNVFDANEVELLTKLYSYLYKVQVSTLTVSSTFEQYSSATINGVLFGSQKTRTASSATVIANWNSDYLQT